MATLQPQEAAKAPLASSGGARTIVVVPTYDERESLPLFVERFAPTGFELLIVDDSSPDGTGALADELAATRPWMHVLHGAEKDGLGMAYRAGFSLVSGARLRRDRPDGLRPLPPARELAEMHAVLLERKAGLVLGSRYLPGGGTDGWSATRLAMSRVRISLEGIRVTLALRRHHRPSRRHGLLQAL